MARLLTIAFGLAFGAIAGSLAEWVLVPRWLTVDSEGWIRVSGLVTGLLIALALMRNARTENF